MKSIRLLKPAHEVGSPKHWRFLRGWFLACIFLLQLSMAGTLHARGEDDLLSVDSSPSQRQSFRKPPPGWEVERTQYLEIQYPRSERTFANRLLLNGDLQVEELSDIMGITPDQYFVVRLVGDDQVFIDVQPGTPPVWAAGTAYSSLGLTILKTRTTLGSAGQAEFNKTFRHELVHLLLGKVPTPIPRWLNEGLARYVAGEFSFREQTILSRAVLLDALIPFSDLEQNFPVGGGRAELAYAQSRGFLTYLSRRFGSHVISEILQELVDGQSFEDALWTATRLNLNTLEDDWHLELSASHIWLNALFGGMSPWVIGALLLVLAYFFRRSRRKARHQRWAAEEALMYGDDLTDQTPQRAPPVAAFRLIPGGRMLESRSEDGFHKPKEADALPSESGVFQSADDGDEEDPLTELFETYQDARRLRLFTEKEEEEDEDRPPGGWLH